MGCLQNESEDGEGHEDGTNPRKRKRSPSVSEEGDPSSWSRKKRRNEHSHRCRAAGRAKKQVKEVTNKRQTDIIQADISIEQDVPISALGYIGRRLDDLPRRTLSVSELVDEHDMEHFPWDGRYGPL